MAFRRLNVKVVVNGTTVDDSMLYEIWHIGHQTYPLERILSVITYYRDEIISTNLAKLEKVCARLNLCKDEDEHYEIRERLL